MQELANLLDVSVALGMADGLDILYVGYRAGHRVGTLRLGVGSVRPIGHTAICSALPCSSRPCWPISMAGRSLDRTARIIVTARLLPFSRLLEA
jgi:hypothetical protein